MCVFVFFKTHATFLTAQPAKCLAQRHGSETVGDLWLSDLTPNKQACFNCLPSDVTLLQT